MNKRNRSIFSLICTFKAVVISSFILSQTGFSHGYISSPESRSLFCKLGGNTNCGAIQFEPQSVEGPDGFPQAGAPDFQLASGGLAAFEPLNEQSADRWKKTVIRPGRNSFSWHFTAPHVTKDYKYYITKANWNPNQKLSRDSFELVPFCVVDGGMVQPPKDITHDCVVPNRQGYHIILALWDVGDTAATFYQVIDVVIDGNANGGVVDPRPQPPAPDNNTPPANNDGNNNGNNNGQDCDNMGNILPKPGDRVCQAVPGSGADDQWCHMNCNHTPSFCPENFCSCN